MELDLEKQNAHKELLEEIDRITDIETEPGHTKFEQCTQKLKELSGDSEDNSGLKLIVSLPWDSVATPELKT